MFFAVVHTSHYDSHQSQNKEGSDHKSCSATYHSTQENWQSLAQSQCPGISTHLWWSETAAVVGGWDEVVDLHTGGIWRADFERDGVI